MPTGYCPVCNFEGAIVEVAGNSWAQSIRCRVCGHYIITEEGGVAINNSPGLERWRLAGALREAGSRSATLPRLHSDNIDAYLSTAPERFDVPCKVQKLLSAIARRSQQPGEWVGFADSFDWTLAYAASHEELLYLTGYSKDRGWIEKQRSEHDGLLELRLTPAGWEEAQRRPRIESAQGFVAMWFDPSMADAFTNGMKAAIEDDCHYRCRRIDAKEYNGDVVDEIMAEIREARFVVCDLTEHRNGVYFEAGFAMGLGVPTIWTCREDYAGKTHFDAEHFNQIRWASPDELRKKLATRIRATIGLGPLKMVAD